MRAACPRWLPTPQALLCRVSTTCPNLKALRNPRIEAVYSRSRRLPPPRKSREIFRRPQRVRPPSEPALRVRNPAFRQPEPKISRNNRAHSFPDAQPTLPACRKGRCGAQARARRLRTAPPSLWRAPRSATDGTVFPSRARLPPASPQARPRPNRSGKNRNRNCI